MGKYNHKEIFNEGISNLLKKGIAGAARAAAAAGGAIKAGAEQGASANIISLGKGAKAGYDKEKEAQKRAVGKGDKLKGYIEDLALLPISSLRGRGDIVVVDVAELDYDNETGEEIKGQRYSKPLVVKWDKDERSWSTVRSPKGDFKGDDKDKGKEEKSSTFNPKVGQEVLVRTKKAPNGEPGVVKKLNPNGRITVATSGNKAGFAFDPNNVIPNPRVKNESISQINLLRKLTLLSR